MKIIVDTNVLVRFFAADDEEQLKTSALILSRASEIIIPIPVFCELVWVLSHSYKFSYALIYEKISCLLCVKNVILKEDEVKAGLLMMEKGGDFADGINEYVGRKMANNLSVFVSFDKKAVRIFSERGISALNPSDLLEPDSEPSTPRR